MIEASAKSIFKAVCQDNKNRYLWWDDHYSHPKGIHYEKLIISPQIAITFIYSPFASLSQMKQSLWSLRKGSDYYWNENHRFIPNNDYIFIFSFCIIYFESVKTANQFPYLSYDKWKRESSDGLLRLKYRMHPISELRSSGLLA